ncbi:MAG: hypothetical protein J6A79_12375 [Clostridia bacterium]|nr:hypothetical protein [Clostridia bacterium]
MDWGVMPLEKRGRPQKYPGRDTAKERKELVELAARLFEVPYDDRILRDPDAPSLNEVARSMDITILKARKLLISSGIYTTELSRSVQRMKSEGKTNTDIMTALGLSKASVNSYLPYEKGAYHLVEPSLYAEQSSRYRRRRDMVRRIKTSNGWPDFTLVWEAILGFEGYPFQTPGLNGQGSRPFTYTVSRTEDGDYGKELIINTKRKTVTKATVELGYKKSIAVLQSEGIVTAPKNLGVPGAGSYLYPIFLKIGLFNR